MFGGSTEPLANCWFRSIGKISEKENAAYAEAIFKTLKQLGDSGASVYQFRRLEEGECGLEWKVVF